MLAGEFCFINNQYYKDFPDQNLMRNKEATDGKLHNRPCFFCFSDSINADIYWLVPASSRYDKYKGIYDKKVQRYGHCKTIVLGELLGKPAAFLIQNMCPITPKYISETYFNKNHIPVRMDYKFTSAIIKNAHDVLRMVSLGNQRIVFPDIMSIYKGLERQLKLEKSIQQESQSLTARLLTAKNQAEYLNSEPMGKIHREHDEPEK